VPAAQQQKPAETKQGLEPQEEDGQKKTQTKAERLLTIAEALREWGQHSDLKSDEAARAGRRAIRLCYYYLELLVEASNRYGCHGFQTDLFGLLRTVTERQLENSTFCGWWSDFTQPHMWAGVRKSLANECARWADEFDKAEEKDRRDKTDIPVYRALDLAKRTVTIGVKTHVITSKNIWDFLKDLCSAFRDDRLVPRLEGAPDNKNNVDQLRKQVGGKDNLHKLILFVRGGGYKLNPDVRILGGGQIGIRKTHLSRKQK
jgi:hypothetical protein